MGLGVGARVRHLARELHGHAWYNRPQEVTCPVPPHRRPPSPFLLLLTSAALTGLVVEWMRFQWGWGVAALPALVGAAWSVWRAARAFRARRAWRRARREADALEAGVVRGRAEGEGPHAVRTRPASGAERAAAPVREDVPREAPPAPEPARPAAGDTLAER